MADVDGSKARILGAEAVFCAIPFGARMLTAAEDKSGSLLLYGS